MGTESVIDMFRKITTDPSSIPGPIREVTHDLTQ